MSAIGFPSPVELDQPIQRDRTTAAVDEQTGLESVGVQGENGKKDKTDLYQALL